MSAQPTPLIPNDLVSVKEAAQIARIQQDTVKRYIHDGRLTCWGTPGRYRVSISELLPCKPRTAPLPHFQRNSKMANFKGKNRQAQMKAIRQQRSRSTSTSSEASTESVA